jgi:hypothetical protein
MLILSLLIGAECALLLIYGDKYVYSHEEKEDDDKGNDGNGDDYGDHDVLTLRSL